ncbi:MAG: beta-glucosidase [Bacteroidia bacterium]|nr:beta-glucosidase [Bacteroidia bacterium]
MKTKFVYFISVLSVFSLLYACKEPPVTLSNAYIESLSVNGKNLASDGTAMNVPVDSVIIRAVFSTEIDNSKINPDKIYVSNDVGIEIEILTSENPKELKLKIKNKLNYYTKYTVFINSGEHLGVNVIDNSKVHFITQLDITPKFPAISDDNLLTLVQQKTFEYFREYAHPVSGLARERTGSGETVTTGGSGFGLMALLVGIERGFITREQGFQRLNTTVNFLSEKAERFHGAFPHWLNGTSGKTIAFSTKDNGADLIETSFLIAGLLTVQSYFASGNSVEKLMCAKIQQLWEGVEWTWFQKNNEPRLYWHWSPNYGWDMNMPITGWNEGLITYVLAASSPTFSITKNVYTEGWARNGAMKNGNKFYDITLPLGENRGGPLFFAHYSFLGLDPRKLADEYANYWQQNTAHAKINYAYCVSNPFGYFGYSSSCWGLTASDIPNGYTASSPTNDRGTIAPTAALASFPYTPEESIRAMRFYYYVLGDKLWGEYGFRDAFNLSSQWFANSYLAIDQGPIVVMIENYRSGLLWNQFMQRDDIQKGLTKLGFTF